MFGGMNSDLSSFIQNTEKYLKALNVRPVTDLGMSNGALTNVRGNNCEIQFPTLRAVYRFSIYVPVGFTENEGMSITINGVTSATFSVFNASSLSDVIEKIKLMPNCEGNPSVDAKTFSIAYDDDFFTIYQRATQTLCSNTNSITMSVQVNQPNKISTDSLLAYTNVYGVINPMQTSPSEIPYPYINQVLDYSLAIIGSTNINSTFYLFTVPLTNTTNIGQIWSLTYSPLSTLDSIFTTKLKLLYNGYLNFSIDYPIAPTAVIGRFELEKIQRVYWSDFNNYVRVCNVADENLMNLDSKIMNIVPETSLSVPTLKKITSNNAVNTLNNTSNYQCAYKYFKSNGGETNFSIPSSLVTLTGAEISGYMGTSKKYCSLSGELNSNINKTITWELNDIDSNYDTIKFYIIIRNSDSFKIFEYEEQVVGDVSSIQTTFFNDTARMIEVSLEEFLIENSAFTTAKTIEQKDNRLFFGNVKNSISSLIENFDTRTYRYAASSETIAYKLYENEAVTFPTMGAGSYAAVPKNADIIPAYNLSMGIDDDVTTGSLYSQNKLYKYKINSTEIGGSGLNISYEFGNELFLADETITLPNFSNFPDNGTDKDIETSDQVYKFGYRKAAPNNDSTCSFNPFFKNINPNNSDFDQKYYTGNVDSQGGAKNSIGHDYFNGNFRSYQQNEIYRFAIVFKSKTGTSSFAKFIGDIKFPNYDDPCPEANRGKPAGVASVPSTYCPDFRRMFVVPANNYIAAAAYVVVPYIKFNVKIPQNILDLIGGYEIVRVQRQDKDKTIATTGIINQVSFINYNSSNGDDAIRAGTGNFTASTPPFTTTVQSHYINYPPFTTNQFANPFWNTLSDPGTGIYDAVTNPDGGDDRNFAHPLYLTYFPFENLVNKNNNLISAGDRLIPSEGYNQGHVGRVNPTTAVYDDIGRSSFYIKKFYYKSYPEFSQVDPGVAGRQFKIANSEYIEQKGTGTLPLVNGLFYENFNFYGFEGQLDPNNSFQFLDTGKANKTQVSSAGSPTVFIVLDATTPIKFQKYTNNSFQAANTYLRLSPAPGGIKSKLIVSHFKPNNLISQYGGRDYLSRSENEYISTNALRKVDDKNFDSESGGVKTYSIKTFGGDLFFGILDIQNSIKNWVAPNTPNSYKNSQAWFLPYSSTYNLDLRSGSHINYNLNSDDMAGASGADEYFYNPAFSTENNLKVYLPEPFVFNATSVYKNRIYWSSVKINGFTSDQWTNIPTRNFYDVDGNYGGINALITLGQNMFFLQDNALGRLLINPASVITDANNSQLRLTNILGNSSVLEKHFYYSVNIGTQHQWSVAKSGSAITFCDINSNKLYLFNGESLDAISDSKGHRGFMNKVLHNRIRITDNPIKYNGILSTYDFKNNEFLYTFLNKGYVAVSGIPTLVDEKYTLAYNELIQSFSSFYSFTPYIYINNGSTLYTPVNYDSSLLVRTKLYAHDQGSYGSFYGEVFPSEIKVLVNPAPIREYPYLNSITKTFDNMSWTTEAIGINYTYFDEINNAFAVASGQDSDNVIYPTDTYSKIRVYNQSQNTDWITTSLTPITGNLRKLEKDFNMQMPRNKFNNNGSSIFDPTALNITTFGDRMRDKFITVDLSYPNSSNNRFIMHNLKTSYRVSDR